MDRDLWTIQMGGGLVVESELAKPREKVEIFDSQSHPFFEPEGRTKKHTFKGQKFKSTG